MKELAIGAFLLCFITLLSAAAIALDADVVLYFPFDEGTGNQVSDKSGNGNDGAIQGNPAWVEGVSGKALEFNGTDDFVEVPNSPSLNITDAVTILAWIKLTGNYPGNYGHIAGINKVGGQTEDTYYLNVGYYNKEHDKVSMGIIGEGTVETPLQGATQVPQNVWTFVAGVFSPGDFMQVYIDGEPDGDMNSVPDTIQVAPSSFTVGAVLGSTGYSFQGVIDEVVVYKRALTGSEVKRVMENGPLAVASTGKLTTSWGRIKNSGE